MENFSAEMPSSEDTFSKQTSVQNRVHNVNKHIIVNWFYIKQGDRDDAQEINAFWKYILKKKVISKQIILNLDVKGLYSFFKIINEIEMYFVYMAL